MSTDRDTTRIVRSWLQEDAHENADRVLDIVLDKIDTTPQRRATWWPVRRPMTMNSTIRYWAAAAVVALAALVGFTFLSNQVGNDPTPTPSPSDTALVPAGLQHPFIGQPKQISALGTNVTAAILKFDGSTFTFWTGSEDTLVSVASVTSSGQLQLATVVRSAGCEPGDEGLYDYSFSPGGSHLTISGTDDCAAREAAVVGDWQTSDCRSVDNFCLGNLEAGSYSSQYFEPRPHGNWAPRFGALTFTVPEGWAADYDFPEEYSLMTQEAYAQGQSDPADAIQVWAAPKAAAADCSEAVEPGVGTSAAELAEWVGQQPGVHSGEPEPVTIGGYDGFVVDVESAAGATGTCGEAGIPLLFGGWHIALGAPDKQRFVFVDIGDGDTALIVIDSVDPATQAAYVGQAMPIVESFQFPPR